MYLKDKRRACDDGNDDQITDLNMDARRGYAATSTPRRTSSRASWSTTTPWSGRANLFYDLYDFYGIQDAIVSFELYASSDAPEFDQRTRRRAAADWWVRVYE
jgi:hypothetical protein